MRWQPRPISAPIHVRCPESARSASTRCSRAPQIVDEAIGHAAAKKVAHKFNLPPLAYEAGLGFVDYQKEIGEDMLAANRDPRIYDMFTPPPTG